MAGTDVVVTSGALQCGHGGVLTVTGSGRLTVGGRAILLAGHEAGLTFPAGPPPGCDDTTTNGAPAPCLTMAARPAGTTSRLTVGHTKVVLGSASGATTSAGTQTDKLTWTVKSAGQSRLTSA